MKPVAQTKFLINGNCLSACVASLLELTIDEVPDYREGEAAWWLNWQQWLRENHGCLFEVYDKNIPPKGYSIGVVPSPTMPGEEHVIICLDGKPVYDPLPPHDRTYSEIIQFWAIEQIKRD